MSRSDRAQGCALALLICAACASSGSFRERVFDDGTVRYRVGSLAQGFERIEVSGNDLAWHDSRSGTISVNATCQQLEDVPARALMNHLLIGTTERVLRVEETVTLDGRAAQHLVADVALDGVPVTIDVYVMLKDGCAYDLTLIAAREKAPAAQAMFAGFVREFAVLSTRLPPSR